MRNKTRLLLILLIWFAALACDEPGMGPKAEKGYRACNPIVDALERFRSEQKSYPEKLTELVPKYIQTLETRVNDFPIHYERRGESFVLHFSYQGPGMNNCDFSPETRWKCEGHY